MKSRRLGLDLNMLAMIDSLGLGFHRVRPQFEPAAQWSANLTRALPLFLAHCQVALRLIVWSICSNL